MQKTIKYLGILTLLLLIGFLSSCDDDSTNFDFNCYNFQKGVATFDEALVRAEMEKITYDLRPAPSLDDKYGHQQNLETLVDRLNSLCQNQFVENVCYACIETYPPQSELLVTVTFEGTQYQQVFDILTSDEKPLEFVDMHD